MRTTALVAALLLASGAGCGKGAPDYPPVAAANAVPKGDVLEKGQWQFLHDTWGTEVLDEWPPADFMLGLMKSEPDVFGNQFASFGFIPDPNDELPFGFKRGIDDRNRVHETCAVCHVGRLPDGRVWLGAPNVALDMGRFQVEVNKRWVAAGNPSKLTDLAITKALKLGPGRFNSESGSYPDVVPADFPNYFMLGKRTRTNYLGTGKNVRTEAFLSIYTFGAGSPNPATAVVPFPTDARVQSFLDFFSQIAPPDAPAGDAAQLTRGAQVFAQAGCASCHHPDDVSLDGVVTIAKNGVAEMLPGVDPTYPRGTIATDPQHRLLIDGGAADAPPDQGYLDLLQFIEDHMLQAGATDGYRANDLHGLWATAPYLHNGSVPTLEALLTPAASRPTTFMRGDFVVDTTQLGNGNIGHEFGATLADADKQALIAYLNSL